MTAFVIVSDLEARWRPLNTAETVVAQAYLDDAMGILETRRPTLVADVLASRVSQAAVVSVITSMVLRVLKNPDGKGEESIDDYRYKRDSSVASGALYVTDDELRLVTGTVIPRARGVRLVAHGELT